MNRSRAMVAVVMMAAALMLTAVAASAQDPSVSVDPSSGLADGDTVTVTATGFPADSTAFVSGQCVTPIADPLQQCDTGNIVPVALDSNGEATFDITLKTGAIGSGTCGAGGDDCVIMVGSLNQPEFGFAPIVFSEGELALTGPQDLAMLLIAGSALLVVGSLVVARSRKVAITV